jgi:hypothetical protein
VLAQGRLLLIKVSIATCKIKLVFVSSSQISSYSDEKKQSLLGAHISVTIKLQHNPFRVN